MTSSYRSQYGYLQWAGLRASRGDRTYATIIPGTWYLVCSCICHCLQYLNPLVLIYAYYSYICICLPVRTNHFLRHPTS